VIRSARRRSLLYAAVAIAVTGLIAGAVRYAREAAARDVRAALYAELRPVTLRNCTLKRYGGPADGGYLLCGNLIQGVQAAYSYGIDKEDEWGCQLSREFQVTIRQYDCFTAHRPACAGGRHEFHDECIGPGTQTIDARRYDSLANQIARNGDAGRRLIVKMDVEGAEWDSLMATPEHVLAAIDQLPMELHGTSQRRFLDVVLKLKRQFHLVNLHYNNHACSRRVYPLAAWAYQVLWVNKRLSELDPAAPFPAPMSPLNAPDKPEWPDCQTPP